MPSRKPVLIFISLGLVGLVGFFIYWIYPREKKEKNTESIKVNEVTPTRFHVILPKGDWYDTGIWISKDQLQKEGVTCWTEPSGPRQPFSVRVGQREIKATLATDNSISSFVATLPPSNDVTDQQKVYLKVDDEAVTDKLDMYVDVGNQERNKNSGVISKWEGDIDSRQAWQNTGLVVTKGQEIVINATGKIAWVNSGGAYPESTVGPEGTSYPVSKMSKPEDLTSYPLPNAGFGTLLIRINQTVLIVGRYATINVPDSGSVEFRVNDCCLNDNSGEFHVVVTNIGKKVQ